MDREKTGGPAFPRPASEDRECGDQPDGNQSVPEQDGMTLRDWFAGKVAAGIAADKGYPWTSEAGEESQKALALRRARACYLMADAMIAARGEESR